MRTCANCGQKFEGRASKLYCGKNCKQAAHRSRHSVEKKAQANAISKPEMKDLNYVGNLSPDAKERLLKIRATCGIKVFRLALDAAYVAVVDTQESIA